MFALLLTLHLALVLLRLGVLHPELLSVSFSLEMIDQDARNRVEFSIG